MINDLKLNLEIHISTQASNLNYESVLFWKNLNAKRIVMAREASKEDIKRIKDETNVDIEIGIHLGLCAHHSAE